MSKSQGLLSSFYVVNIIIFQPFLLQHTQKQSVLENHEIYYIGAAELPLRFTHCAPLLGWRYLQSSPSTTTPPPSDAEEKEAEQVQVATKKKAAGKKSTKAKEVREVVGAEEVDRLLDGFIAEAEDLGLKKKPAAKKGADDIGEDDVETNKDGDEDEYTATFVLLVVLVIFTVVITTVVVMLLIYYLKIFKKESDEEQPIEMNAINQ